MSWQDNMNAALGRNNAGTSEDENKQYDTASTPVDNQLYDYATQSQPAADNPYATAGATTDTSSFDTTPTQEQAPQETTPQQPQTTADMIQAATEANSNTHEALRDVTSDEMNNIYQKTGVSADEWARITSPGFNVQGLMADTNPERQKYRDAINMYMGFAQSAAPAATPAPTQAPAQETAPQQNPILPSAGGNYQADSIYDPSKTYGRQPDGSYVYSSSAAQLQRDLNRTMNAGLTVDGYFGEKTQQALNAYLSQYGKPNGSASAAGAGQMYDAPIGPTPPQPGSSATTLPANTTTAPGTATSAALAASAAEAPTTPSTPFESQPTEQREPINYAAMLDELNQMDRNDWYQRPESQATTQREPINYNAMADELAQLERNDWYQRPESQSASAPERTPINYDAMSNELFQMDRNDWYQRPETPQAPERTPLEYSDAFIRQQDMNDAYSPRQSYNNNYMAELERLQEPQVNEAPQARQPLEYSDAFIRQEEMRDAYSPNQTFNDSYRAQLERIQKQEDTTNPDTVSSDDIQATASTTPRASQVGDSMSRALADNQARPDTNIFREDAPPVVSPQREEQYKTLFNNEIGALKQMYPDASYSQLYDYLRLFYEQNGDTNTDYYRWFNSFL